MKYSFSVAAMAAGLASAQSIGGALPAGIQVPNPAGFAQPVALPSRGGRAVCISGTIPVPATSTKNLKFNFDIPKNQTGVTQTFLSFIADGSPFMKEIMGGMQTVNGTYQISGSLCGPANAQATQLQFLTHGVGFDRYYWDFAPGYSYVDVAADAGIATFIYDRLGVGASEKADPLNVVQAPLEVEIANNLAKMVKAGAIGGIPFQKVIGVGHSFGSLISQAITARYPSTFDGVILTGFSTNMTGLAGFISGLNLGIASQVQPYRFAGLDNGYLLAGSAVSNQIAFFNFPGFDPLIAAAANAQDGSVTYGELFTQGVVSMPAMNYSKPVAVVNGLEDLPFCFGNCTYPSNKAQAAITMLYPKANASATYFAPNAGHGLNLHYSALDAYHWIQNFVQSNVH